MCILFLDSIVKKFVKRKENYYFQIFNNYLLEINTDKQPRELVALSDAGRANYYYCFN